MTDDLTYEQIKKKSIPELMVFLTEIMENRVLPFGGFNKDEVTPSGQMAILLSTTYLMSNPTFAMMSVFSPDVFQTIAGYVASSFMLGVLLDRDGVLVPSEDVTL